VSSEQVHASLLFQAICERYEKRQSVILTSNKVFADWGQVFAGDTIMASAALDRLLHRFTVINIRGDRSRLKEKRIADAAAVERETLVAT
jgi:DNA replication protein DnaC